MYILPLLLSNLHLDLNTPFNSMDPIFGRTNHIRPEELVSRIPDRYDPINFDRGIVDFYYRSGLKNLPNYKQHVISTTSIDDNVFKITINVQQYKPEEITVKVVDRSVVVEAKHEAKQDENNVISRQFVRQYLLPNRADVDQVTATISSDGVLIIAVPLKPNERMIKIEQTGQPAISSNNQDTDRNKILTDDSSNNQAGASEPTIEKKAEDNEVIREEVTQTQEARPKPEK